MLINPVDSNLRYIEIILLFGFLLYLAAFVVLLLDLFFRESPCLRPQHIGNLLLRHADLVSNGNYTVCQIEIVFPQNAISYHDVVDVLEDKSPSIDVFLLSLEEGAWMVFPMAQRIEMVGRMPAVIEAMAIALEVTGSA